MSTQVRLFLHTTEGWELHVERWKDIPRPTNKAG